MNLEIRKTTTHVGIIDIITMENDFGMKVVLINYGAALFKLMLKNSQGIYENMVVAPDDLETFLKSSFYYGKTVGRTSGRLVVPSYQIDEQSFIVRPYRAGLTSLHGGRTGFSFRSFKVIDEKKEPSYASVKMRYQSKHLEEDYPGNLTLDVTYCLDNEMNLTVIYEATTDQDTLCNITNHTYFNLNPSREPITNHNLQIHASKYLDIDQNHIIHDVKQTNQSPFDFKKIKSLMSGIKHMKKTSFNGFDHTWILDDHEANVDVIRLYSSLSDVGMRVYTSYPSVVIYTHNHVAPDVLKDTRNDGIHSALTLECQFEPGGIHDEELNSAILRKGETYHHFIRFQMDRKI
ncbi:MAG: galactose mutarotase [Acholeplasmataceae bacterium]|nr:galactose mutarotase [Acholeplasmataceae bacterium]